MSYANWSAGAIVAMAIGLGATGRYSERSAQEIVERLGGHCEIEPRFGLNSLGVVVEAELVGCAPTAADLAELRNLRHLRVLDLSLTPIGDRELLQLVDASCPCIVVPPGQISEAVQAMFRKDQIALGLAGHPGTDGELRSASRISEFSPLWLMAALSRRLPAWGLVLPRQHQNPQQISRQGDEARRGVAVEQGVFPRKIRIGAHRGGSLQHGS